VTCKGIIQTKSKNMKINFKQPKYVLPLIVLPFLCLFFFVWHNGFSKPKKEARQVVGLNGSVGNVSVDVRKKNLADKLDAYRNTFKQSDGLTAVNAIQKDTTSNPSFHDNYSDRERKTLDSINQAMKAKFSHPQPISKTSGVNRDQELAKAISGMANRQKQQPRPAEPKEKDPMEMFKAQMAYMDSIQKQNDPAYKAERLKKLAADKAAQEKASEVNYTVVKAGAASDDFNTIKPPTDAQFIMATIDENETGYAGSRLRLRLLEDIKAGNNLIPRGTYLFALISGFSQQRVTLSITSILSNGKILPVKLEIYDLDGMPGLYVPSSAFRDFTKDLGGNTVQGVSVNGNSTSFIMSSVDKMFQSTSSAIAELVRKNKARLKYNSYIYLIDKDALKSAQKSY
jgi:conjugative transposon TraM protein